MTMSSLPRLAAPDTLGRPTDTNVHTHRHSDHVREQLLVDLALLLFRSLFDSDGFATTYSDVHRFTLTGTRTA
jgi:hypothetical protein